MRPCDPQYGYTRRSDQVGTTEAADIVRSWIKAPEKSLRVSPSPSAAIIISTLVAARLAKTERLATAAARAEERIQVAADRLEARSDDAFVRALGALATLNTINLRAKGAAEPLRDLRVGLTPLDAASGRDDELLAEWFEAERLACVAQASESLRRLGLTPKTLMNDADVEAVVAAGGRINAWARDFANNLRTWRRKGATDAELRGLAKNAETLH